MSGRLDPSKGGCLFCHSVILEHEPKKFSEKLDAQLHESCLQITLDKVPLDEDAVTVAKEFGMEFQAQLSI